jgi:glycosyltransferase involved in cell wall biosynthesis
MPECVASKAARAFAPIAMSQFGVAMCERIGLNALYVPHAIDTTVFAPMDRQEARSLTSLPSDRYIVGMVAANKGNPSRKAFPQQLEAFKLFQQRYEPDAALYLHTSTGQYEGDAVNLIDLCDALELVPGRDVLFVDQYSYRLGCPDAQMAALYNSFDVLINASLGEGFGIPIVEAQACGTPVVVGDWTAMGELAFAGSLALPKGDATKVYTALASYQWSVHPEALCEALAAMWHTPPLREPLRTAALAYDAALIRETHWRPALHTIERRMHERNGHAQNVLRTGVLV